MDKEETIKRLEEEVARVLKAQSTSLHEVLEGLVDEIHEIMGGLRDLNEFDIDKEVFLALSKRVESRWKEKWKMLNRLINEDEDRGALLLKLEKYLEQINEQWSEDGKETETEVE